MEIPSERGSIASFDQPSATGVITLDAGGSANFTVTTINAANPGDARNWPTLQAASFIAGQRILCKTDGGGTALLVMPDPYAVDLDGTGEVA